MNPLARQQLLDLLLEIIQNPSRTIIISSHILSDVEKVIDHVLILDRGKILRDCTFDDLREEFCRARLTAVDGALPEPLPIDGILREERSGNQALLTMRDVSPARLEQLAEDINCQLELLPLSLDDSYRLVMEGRINQRLRMSVS